MQLNAIQSNTMQATTTTTQATTTTPSHRVVYDFENDDDSFYDLIDFGISSNRGRLSIKRA